jgi:hypothetical protein
VISRNVFDQGSLRLFAWACDVRVSRLESKFLNNRKESRVWGVVTNLRIFRKIFTNSLRSIAVTAIFQSASSCYGDKWLAKRDFSRFFLRVTPPDALRKKNQGRFRPHDGNSTGGDVESNSGKKKKPGDGRALSESFLRSVHFANLAI